MSVDHTLKSKSMLERHRNVLTRAERIEHLQEVGKWGQDSKPIGLPKIRHRKLSVGKKSKAEKKPTEGEAATPPAS